MVVIITMVWWSFVFSIIQLPQYLWGHLKTKSSKAGNLFFFLNIFSLYLCRSSIHHSAQKSTIILIEVFIQLHRFYDSSTPRWGWHAPPAGQVQGVPLVVSPAPSPENTTASSSESHKAFALTDASVTVETNSAVVWQASDSPVTLKLLQRQTYETITYGLGKEKCFLSVSRKNNLICKWPTKYHGCNTGTYILIRLTSCNAVY